MFYVKADINDACSIKIDITDENVFTTCPKCGVEQRIDIQEILSDDVSDLYGTSVYCTDCTLLLQEEREKQKWEDPGAETNSDFDFAAWKPKPEDEEKIYAELHGFVIATAGNCGSYDEETQEALDLYCKVVKNGIDACKKDIQDHFVEMYYAVDGDLSYYNDSPELVKLIKLTCHPKAYSEE